MYENVICNVMYLGSCYVLMFHLRMLQLTDHPVGDLLGLGRDVEHVEVNDAAHDSVPPQI